MVIIDRASSRRLTSKHAIAHRLALPRERPRVGEAHVRRKVCPHVLRPPRAGRHRLNEHAEQLHVLALLVQLEEARPHTSGSGSTSSMCRHSAIGSWPRKGVTCTYLGLAPGRGGLRISLPRTTSARGGHTSMPVESLGKTTNPSLSCRLRLLPRDCARSGGPWAERLVPAGRMPLGGKALGAARAGRTVRS